MKDHYKNTQRWRYKIRQWLNEMMGGSCQGCGYDKYFGNLAFHHLYGKDESVSKMINRCASTASLIQETDKCVLVCHNCHGEIHAGIRPCPVIDIVVRRKRMEAILGRLPKPKTEKTKPCDECGKDVPATRKYCNQECSHKAQEKVDWPDNLRALVDESSVLAVARRLGVSDKAVKKRLDRTTNGGLLSS